MNFAEKVFNLRGEIINDLKELVLKHGIDSGYERNLDCWGYRFANGLKTIHFITYSSIVGLRFDTGLGENNLSYQSDFTIDELANLADILHMYYKD